MALWSLESVGVRGRLEALTLTVEPGVTVVRGPSGAGKTTLLDLLCGFVTADSGAVSRPEGFVLWCGCGQGLWADRTAGRQIEDVGGDPGEWLQRFGLGGRSSRKPAALSLGERSRLELARALAAGPEVLLMDEPLTHVDAGRAAAGWAAVAEFAAGGGSVVVATHEAGVEERLGGRTVRLESGRVVDG